MAIPKLFAPMTINGFVGEYRWLSNFWQPKCSIIYDGEPYDTVENAYQAAKCLNKQERRQFQNISPGEAKRRGYTVKLRPDWETIKFDIMVNLVFQKFRGDRKLRAKLLATGDSYIENTSVPNDYYWGLHNGCGHNQLGNILMLVRAVANEGHNIQDNK